jgi:DNA-binding beta-propeller fold protein YncE
MASELLYIYRRRSKMSILKNFKKVTAYILLISLLFVIHPEKLCGNKNRAEHLLKKEKGNKGIIEKNATENQGKRKRKRSIWPYILGGVTVAAIVFFLVKKHGSDDNDGPITVTEWGKRGSEPGQFLWADDICLDDEGYVYVSDGGNRRIQKFTQNGEFIIQFNTGSSEFSPRGLEIYGRTLYVCDGDRVALFSSGGRFKGSWPITDPFPEDEKQPTADDITFDSSGNGFVTDTVYHRVLKFSGQGVVQAIWDIPPGNPADSYGTPAGIAVLGSEIFVTDRSTGEIKVFDQGGNFVRKWSLDSADTGRPGRIAAYDNSELLVCSLSHSQTGHMIWGKISRFDSSGTFLGFHSHSGLSPKGIAVNWRKQKIYTINYYHYVAVLDLF